MKRNVTKQKSFSPFIINLNELGNLCSKLAKEFDDENNVRTYIEVKLPGESLSFDSTEDFKNYDRPQRRLRKFSICMSQGDNYFLINKGVLQGDYHIYSSSNKDSWCAGVIEVADKFMRDHRVWYFFVHKLIFKIFVSVLPSLIVLSLILMNFEESTPSSEDFTNLISTLLLLGIIFWFVYSSILNYLGKGILVVSGPKSPLTLNILNSIYAISIVVGAIYAVTELLSKFI